MKTLRFQSRSQVQKSISSSVRKLLPWHWHQSPCQLLCLREFLRLGLPSTLIRHENRNISKTVLFENIAWKHVLRPGPQRERRQTKGPGKRGHIVADTLLPMMFPGLRKLGNISCGHKMFLNKIRNIFCVPDTKFVSATNVPRAGKRENICVGNNVSATICPR